VGMSIGIYFGTQNACNPPLLRVVLAGAFPGWLPGRVAPFDAQGLTGALGARKGSQGRARAHRGARGTRGAQGLTGALGARKGSQGR
jgi:hypothetical protein